jgi:putative ABC transport system ATP-binding protein
VGQPDVIFADEPTGALDTRSGRDVLALLRATVDEGDRTLVMVTHDPSAAAWADRVVFMADGRLAGELAAPTAEQVAERLTGLGA